MKVFNFILCVYLYYVKPISGKPYIHTVNLKLAETTLNRLNETDWNMAECFKELLIESQSCENRNLMYYERQGGG
jgi:hypothetical protein